jgi:hypothetical protein
MGLVTTIRKNKYCNVYFSVASGAASAFYTTVIHSHQSRFRSTQFPEEKLLSAVRAPSWLMQDIMFQLSFVCSCFLHFRFDRCVIVSLSKKNLMVGGLMSCLRCD